MIKRMVTLFIFLAVLFSSGFAAVPAALASSGPTDIAVIDQMNTPFVALTDNIQILGPVGQEFTPVIAGLDAFELWTEDFFPGNGQGSNLQVVIRKDKISGEIIARSALLSLPDKFVGITRFRFPRLVNLRPAKLYVVQLMVVSGDHWMVGDDWGVGSSGGPVSTYPGGNWIIGGVSTPGNDLWFVEGLAKSVPRSIEYCKAGLWQVVTRANGTHFKNQGSCIVYVFLHRHGDGANPYNE